jgi:hypothetical protein
MINRTRRDFLADVGRGMLLASVGPAVAADLGLATAAAADGPARLTFGPLEPLVELMTQTPAAKLVPALVDKLKSGTELKTLVAAGALANARTFGGQDYIGYHAFMALAPAYDMARELPEAERPLPVLKVLYRNTQRMQAGNHLRHVVLKPVAPVPLPKDQVAGEVLRAGTRRRDWAGAEGTFAALAQGPAGEAFNHLQYSLQDEVDVHRVVLAWRAWATLDLTGQEHAHTLLRQSVRYCMSDEDMGGPHHAGGRRHIRDVLPRLLDQHRLLSKSLGNRAADDAWVEQMARTVYASSPEQAADAVAAALAEGIDPKAISEAVALVATRLVLCDPGRGPNNSSTKPRGSVHGDSVGVHASDAANAWRNIARVSNHRNTVASLVISAFHTAGQTHGLRPQPWPRPEDLEKITTQDPAVLVHDLAAAIQNKDQARACALVHRYGELGHDPEPVTAVLLRYAVSEDGALHAEKYYRTATEEFRVARPAFRWRHLAALARVTASEYGYPAAGYREARQLLRG